MMVERLTTVATVNFYLFIDFLVLICHLTVWSNFEIADLDFWRSETYIKYFDFLDQKGGFYYEVCFQVDGFVMSGPDNASQRWGDAPVHSIAAALFARKDQIHFFNDIGYRHEPFQHCPQGESHKRGKCWCDPAQNFGLVLFPTFSLVSSLSYVPTDYEWYSCLNRYDKLF
jgi:alpha 1,2-mannosyltransferase